MNRIILIGNGFDLAHGLETSYKHFIDWFWKNEIEKIEYFISANGNFLKLKDFEDEYINFNKDNLGNERNCINWFESLKKKEANAHIFKNKFLYWVLKHQAANKWVDIRNEKSHEHIANYITNNPINWKNDKFYK